MNKTALIAFAAAVLVVVIGVAEYYALSSMLVSSPSPGSSPNSTALQTPTVATDLNWGGYAVASDFNNPQPVVTAVSASWIVPQVTVSNDDAFSAIWVGIGGTFGNTLIQGGTEQDSIGGAAYYSAWYELLPRDSVTIQTIDVSPGDVINASVLLLDQTADLWQISITDLTSGQSFVNTFVYASSQLSAEWVVERPTVNNVLSPLANVGTVSMSKCATVVETCPGTVSQFSNIQNVMSNKQRTPLVQVSNLGSDGSSFSVKYLQSQ